MSAIVARLLGLWGSEPVVITAVVDGVLMLLISFGLPIDDSVKQAIDGLLVALGVLIARSQVSPAQ